MEVKMAGRNYKFSCFGLVFFAVLIVYFLGGCGSIVKLDYSSRLIGNAEYEGKFYVSEIEDVRPKKEKEGEAFMKRVLWSDLYYPLPEIAFEPAAPATFLKQSLASEIGKVSKMACILDSADYVISGSLDHLSIQQRPSTLTKVSGCSVLGTSLLALLIASFGDERASGIMMTLLFVPTISTMGMAAGNIEYVGNMQVTINIERVKDGALRTKSFSSERKKRLSGLSSLEQTEFINSIFEETMDKILHYLITGEKKEND
jgi:hypothetical protein